MLENLKTGGSALIGLALGVLITLPMFWFGVKNGVGALEHNAQSAFVPVEKRHNVMSDEVLRLEQLLKRLGWKDYKKYKADFAKVERQRATLAGDADFDDKVEISQDLERSLMNVESIARQAAEKDRAIGKNPYVKEFFENWHKLKRYLVDEEMQFTAAVHHYNGVLATWPVPVVTGYRSAWGMMRAMGLELWANLSAWARQGWLWAKFGASWLWYQATHKGHPVAPEPLLVKHPAKDPLFHPLPVPYYLAQAPIPEEDYREIQFDREVPSMADVDVQEDEPVFEGQIRRQTPVPLPTVQKTVTY